MNEQSQDLSHDKSNRITWLDCRLPTEARAGDMSNHLGAVITTPNPVPLLGIPLGDRDLMFARSDPAPQLQQQQQQQKISRPSDAAEHIGQVVWRISFLMIGIR